MSIISLNENQIYNLIEKTVFNFVLVRNSTGEIVQISGVGGQMLDWLSSYYNLTYYLIILKI